MKECFDIAVLERILKIRPRVHMGSSSARAIIMKKGFGRTRHGDVGLLWVQKLTAVGLLVKVIAGKENRQMSGQRCCRETLW